MTLREGLNGRWIQCCGAAQSAVLHGTAKSLPASSRAGRWRRGRGNPVSLTAAPYMETGMLRLGIVERIVSVTVGPWVCGWD